MKDSDTTTSDSCAEMSAEMTEDTAPNPSITARIWYSAKAVVCVPLVSLAGVSGLMWVIAPSAPPESGMTATELLTVGLLGPTINLYDRGYIYAGNVALAVAALVPLIVFSQLTLSMPERHRHWITAAWVLFSGFAWGFIGFFIHGLNVT